MSEKMFTSVAQIGIVVRDAAASASHYQTLLGIKEWHFNHVDTKNGIGKKFHTRKRAIDAKAKIAWAHLGGVEIELIEPLDTDSIYAEHLKENGPGLHHIMFETSDYEQSRLHMANNDIAEMAGGELQATRFTMLETREQLGMLCEIAEGGLLVPDSVMKASALKKS